jgi:hypothetical protein
VIGLVVVIGLMMMPLCTSNSSKRPINSTTSHRKKKKDEKTNETGFRGVEEDCSTHSAHSSLFTTVPQQQEVCNKLKHISTTYETIRAYTSSYSNLLCLNPNWLISTIQFDLH